MLKNLFKRVIPVKELTLYRVSTSDEGTLGVLQDGRDVVCWTLELPDRDNKRFISRIPNGIYDVKHMNRSYTGKYRDVYHVQDVVGRDGVLIHKGNWAGDTDKEFDSDSSGCILVGLNPSYMRNQLSISGSKTALHVLHGVVGRKSFKLRIVSYE